MRECAAYIDDVVVGRVYYGCRPCESWLFLTGLLVSVCLIMILRYRLIPIQSNRRNNNSGGISWGKVGMGFGAGWLIGGKIHSKRKEKKLNVKHKEEQKALYTQYYNDVYSLQQQNAELAQALEQLGYRVQ